MSKDNYDDLEEEFLDEEEGGFLSLMSVVIGFLAIAGFITLAWYAYRTGTESLQIEELEVVKADESPLKEQPEDPGGWQFPHKDKTVYDTIATREKEQPMAATTMPAPEEPVERPVEGKNTEAWINKRYQEQKTSKVGVEEVKAAEKQKAAAEAAMKKEKEAKAKAKAEAEIAAKEKAAKKAEEKAKAEAAKKDAPKPVEKVEKETSQPTKKEAAVVATKQKSVSGGPRVQLGAFKSQKEADATWGRIMKKHKSLLGNYDHDVVRADLGKKGVFYRLQVVPFESASAAKSLCKQLSSRKQDCFVVVP